MTRQPLAGAQFQITYANGGLVADNEGLTSSNGLYTTNRDGQIVLSRVTPGTLVVTEVRAPDNYRPDPNPQTVVINPADTQTLRYYNDPLCTLTILKRDAVTKKPLAKAEFLVRDSEGRAIGPNNGRYITGTDGTVTVTGLAPNATIVVSESKAPAGYILDETPKNIVVRTGVANSLIFDNQPGTTLIIRKFIEGTENEPLSGVAFKVIDGSGAAVGPDDGTYYTDKAGEIVLSGIEPGTTVIAREIKTVEGFVLDGTPQKILIKGGEVQSLTFWNKRDCSLTILKQSTDKTPLTGAIFHVTDEDGAAIGTNNGRYTTDRNGLITITGLQPGQVLVVTEEKAPNGYVRDMTPKIIKIKQDAANSLIFENARAGSLVINKRSSVDKAAPLEGVTFKITTANGDFLPDETGKISSNGLYYTDSNGQIILNSVVGTLVVTEVQSIDGYTIHEANRTQTVEVRPDDTQTLYWYNDPLCSLTITKLDSVSGKPVPNTEFTLKDGSSNLLGKYTTGKDGTVTVGGLLPGSTVIVTETCVPSGYVLNPIPQAITVKNGSGNTLTSGGSSSSGWSGNGLIFENDPTVTLTIRKYIDGTGNEPLPGVTFRVTDGSGAGVGPDGGTYQTNSAGEIVLKDLEPGMTVTAREIRTVDGFVLDGEPQSIEIKAGPAQSLTFWNKRAGNLIIRKLDSITKEPLAGVEFKVTYADGSAVDTANGTISSNGAYVTDANGEIRISGIVGSIVITETRTIDGYTIDEASRVRTVTVDPNDTQTVTIYNVPRTTLVIQKFAEGAENTPLAGVEFLVTDGSGAPVGRDNGRFVTDLDGRIVIGGLPSGMTVTARETKAADGYLLDNSPQTIRISEGTVQTLTFRNRKAGNLIIRKLDSATKKPLAGVEFRLTYTDGSFVDLDGGKVSSQGLYTTNSDGEIVVSGVVGSIVITETKALPGYTIDENERSRTVQVNPEDTQTVTFWNAPLGGLILHKLDSATKRPLAGVQFRITYADGRSVDAEGGKLSTGGLYTTDTNGQIRLSGIEGTLVITEEKTIDGYTIDENTRSQTVVVRADSTSEVTFYNTRKQALIIEKLVEGTRDEPLAGVEFLITDSAGTRIGPENGIYRTDRHGRIYLYNLEPGTVITAKETKTVEGFVLDSTPQSIEIRSGEVQRMTFYNSPVGGLELIKVSEADKTTRIPGAVFEIRRMDGGLVDTVTTGDNGRVFVELDAGNYCAVEIDCPKEYKVDAAPHYFEIQDGKTTTLTATNKPFSGILIRKTDSVTGKGISGVTFLLYDSGSNPIGQYASDNSGFVYIEGLTASGRYFLRELESKGYLVDSELKTVYVTAGETALVEWKNTPVTGQIQIAKTSAEYNAMNGWPAGTPLPDTEFEIYEHRSGNLVDTIRTDKNGIARSRPLPLGRYKVVESKSASFYGLDRTPMEAEIEFAGQIVRLAMTNKSLSTNVSITKRGYSEVVPGQSIKYDFSSIGNNSTTALTSFYWRDTLPVQAVRLDKIITGTYNVPGSYKIVYKTNLHSEYHTMYDNLNTQQNRTLDASPAALGLAANECVTEFLCVFGVVPEGFRQVEAAAVWCSVLPNLAGGSRFVNQADAGGVYNGQWIMATDRWVTTVYKPSQPLPRTGY